MLVYMYITEIECCPPRSMLIVVGAHIGGIIVYVTSSYAALCSPYTVVTLMQCCVGVVAILPTVVIIHN